DGDDARVDVRSKLAPRTRENRLAVERRAFQVKGVVHRDIADVLTFTELPRWRALVRTGHDARQPRGRRLVGEPKDQVRVGVGTASVVVGPDLDAVVEVAFE